MLRVVSHQTIEVSVILLLLRADGFWEGANCLRMFFVLFEKVLVTFCGCGVCLFVYLCCAEYYLRSLRKGLSFSCEVLNYHLFDLI